MTPFVVTRPGEPRPKFSLSDALAFVTFVALFALALGIQGSKGNEPTKQACPTAHGIEMTTTAAR